VEVEEQMPTHEAVTMPESEEQQVNELDHLLKLGPPALIGPNETERLNLPHSIYSLLKDIVRNMQRGKSILVIPEDEDLTTQTAANILGVSRPHVVKLLESGKIPFHKTGSHRRLRLKDVLAYSKQRDSARKTILNNLAKEAFDSGLYDNAAIPEGGEDE
jgi:excisionase family DNA binding protein